MQRLRDRLIGPTLVRILALAPVLVLAARPAGAWDHQGHQAVGGIADQLIAGTPTAERVRQVLGGGSLQAASVWADCARAVESTPAGWRHTGSAPACAPFATADGQAELVAFVARNATQCGGLAGNAPCRHKTYHYTDISILQPRYDPALPGARPDDLVQALAATIGVLQGRAPAGPIRIAGPREALRLLAHYLGDLHQPLHVGSVYLSDAGQPIDPATPKAAAAHDNAGGNRILLNGRQLHATWDDVRGPLRKRLLAGTGAAQARRVPPTTGPIDAWPTAWADDTLVAARQAFQGVEFEARSGEAWPATADEPAYSTSREALQQAQLVKAGARLAQILTALWP